MISCRFLDSRVLTDGWRGGMHVQQLAVHALTAAALMNTKTPELPTVTLAWHASKYTVYQLHQRYIHPESHVPNSPYGICGRKAAQN